MMVKWLKSCFIILVLLLMLVVVGIIFLDLGSNWYIRSTPTSTAPEILVCHLDYYPRNEAKIQLLAELVRNFEGGVKIENDALDQVVVLAPQADMPGLNGIVCNGMIIVSSRLEGPARYYVIRHELEHVFQMEGLRAGCQDWELCATWAAVPEHPVGFILAIISSLQEAYRLSPTVWDFLFSSWYVFKVYFLP